MTQNEEGLPRNSIATTLYVTFKIVFDDPRGRGFGIEVGPKWSVIVHN
jgi:hypothetical protein